MHQIEATYSGLTECHPEVCGFFFSLVLLRATRCTHSWIKCDVWLAYYISLAVHTRPLFTHCVSLGIILRVLVVYYLKQYPSLIYQNTREENAHGVALCLGGDRPLFQWPIILKPQSSEKCPIETKSPFVQQWHYPENKTHCSEGQNKLYFPFWNTRVSMIVVHLCQIKTFL